MNYDVIIVGAGPAGIFTALEMLRNGSKSKILLIEKGKPVEKRHCPKAEIGKFVSRVVRLRQDFRARVLSRMVSSAFPTKLAAICPI